MVYYFTTTCGEYTIYMGKDKYENEDLIKYGWPEDCWFHVDDLSSAHVYLRLKPGQAMDDIPEHALTECCSLVKANSIAGCKKSSVYIVYTRHKNLKKTASMVDGQVGYHRPENVRRTKIEKNNTIVRQLEKTKKELHPDLAKEQEQRLQEIQAQKKEARRAQDKATKLEELERAKKKEEMSYDRIMGDHQMTSNTGEFVIVLNNVCYVFFVSDTDAYLMLYWILFCVCVEMNATEDATAAEEFEDDFM